MPELKDAKDKMIKARIALRNTNPFFSYLIMHLQPTEDEAVITMAVNDTGVLTYNPKWVETLTETELIACLAHEVMHLVFEHPKRCLEREHILYNVAGDLVINDVLVNNNFHMPQGTLTPKIGEHTFKMAGIKTVKDLDKKSSEEVYEELNKEAEKQLKNLIGQIKNLHFCPSNKPGPGAGNKDGTKKSDKDSAFSDAADKFKPKDKDKGEEEGGGLEGSDKEEPEKLDWKKVFAEAAIYAKMRGDFPANLERFFDRLFEEKLNWKELLYKYIVNTLPFDFTYARPSKKSEALGMYLPGILKENLEVVISVDVSGSIDKVMLTEFVSEVAGILKSFQNVNVTLLTHDTEVHDVFELSNDQDVFDVKVHGGGGTSHDCVYKWLDDRSFSTDLLISFTDGYSHYPTCESTKTLFALTKDHQVPPWGDTVVIE